MIRPVGFGYNAQTAVNNAFQAAAANQEMVQQNAVREFDAFVEKLRAAGVTVMVVEDTPEPHTPDSIFPNNWVTFHGDGTLQLYPMFAENRRLERKQNVLEQVKETFKVNNIRDYSHFEADQAYLEGTGSMVLDRENKIAYACLGPRTHEGLLKTWCKDNGYKCVCFEAEDDKGTPIYHTNVLMAVADKYVVICLDSIFNIHEKGMLIHTIQSTHKTIVPISFEQMNHFAGNMLQVQNDKGEKILVMSEQAWQSLDQEQQDLLISYNRVIYSNLQTIESNGGGSARCMMAEIHLPKI